MKTPITPRPRGGTLLGLLLGTVLGGLIALGVVWFIDSAPPPTFAKDTLQSGSPEAERARNQNWDPNAALYGANPATGTARVGTPAPDSASPAQPAAPEVVVANAPDPIAAIAAAAQSNASDPSSDAAPAANSDGYQYFVQAGAYRLADDAQAQRAKILMLGWDPRITEREENGSPIYRVRLGPFAKRGDADQLSAELHSAGIATTLVRVKLRQ